MAQRPAQLDKGETFNDDFENDPSLPADAAIWNASNIAKLAHVIMVIDGILFS
jgi:hypothetical protein